MKKFAAVKDQSYGLQVRTMVKDFSRLDALVSKYQLEDDLYNITHFFIQEKIGNRKTHVKWYKIGCDNGHMNKLRDIRNTSQISKIYKELSKTSRKARKDNYVVDKISFILVICMVSGSCAKGKDVALGLLKLGLNFIVDSNACERALKLFNKKQ
jgi:hypothetical protein